MRRSILIDATHYHASEPTGVELYVDSLLPHLCSSLISHGIIPLTVGHTKVRPSGLPDGAEWVYSPYQTWWGQRTVPSVVADTKANGYFTPSGLVPLRHTVPQAMSVHDLSVFTFPGAYRWGQRVRMKYLGVQIGKAAKVICAPSEYTKNQVVQYWHIPENRITVTPLALPSETTEHEVLANDVQVPNSMRTFDLKRPMILYVGRLESKKNLETIVAAFQIIHDRLKNSGHTSLPQLVLAGSYGHGFEHIRKQISSLTPGARNDTYLPGYVEPAGKKFLYSKASVSVVPGGHEGFGLGILEGYHYNVPVIGAEAGAVPEVVASAGMTVSPYSDSGAWAEAILKALQDTTLRDHWVTEGNRRLQAYTWEKTARLTSQAIASMLS